MNIGKKRAILYMLAILFGISGVSGLLRGRNSHQEQPEQTPVPCQTAAPAGQVSAAAEVLERYVLVAEGGFLNLYRVTDTRALVKSEKFDAMLYPAEDIRQLQSGIEFDTAQEAYEYLENYVS